MNLPPDMPRQPTDTSPGPACLRVAHRYSGGGPDGEGRIDEVPQFKEGGTSGVDHGLHAARRRFSARIISSTPRFFDPARAAPDREALNARRRQRIPSDDVHLLLPRPRAPRAAHR